MTRQQQRYALAAALADAFLGPGPWTPAALIERAAVVLGARRRWLRLLTRPVLAAYRDRPADRPRELTALVELALAAVLPADRPVPAVRVRSPVPTGMGPARWPVPPLETVADLADWLGLDAGELLWFADPWSLERRVPDESLRHYSYRQVRKPRGGSRLLEVPKSRLKALQRRVLHQVLDRVPPHPAAYGFRPGGSVAGYARPHVGQAVVLRFDLEDFFASVPVGRVHGIFRAAGYPEPVAHLLAGLTTNSAPGGVLRHLVDGGHPAAFRTRRRLAAPHLPQGAPTSPALANLAALGLDRRLAGLAAYLDAAYTRYADDLAFSGGTRLGRRAGTLLRLVGSIAADEGFRLNERKTRFAARSGRQSVGGLVVNERLGVPRDALDELRAIVHNCATHGPEGQNRAGVPDFRAHLLGRISWVAAVQPERGARLRAEFDRIQWPAADAPEGGG